jgi:hypothetical protein
LIRGLNKAINLEDDMKARMDAVKVRRDFLAHHFFRERSVEFATRAGRDSMIEELERDHDLFQQADREVDALIQPYRAALGMSEEVLEFHYQKFLRDEIKQD